MIGIPVLAFAASCVSCCMNASSSDMGWAGGQPSTSGILNAKSGPACTVIQLACGCLCVLHQYMAPQTLQVILYSFLCS